MSKLTQSEEFAATYSDQWLGCPACKESHHTDSFCSCGRCFHQGEIDHDEYGTVVHCECGKAHWWD